MTWHRTVGPRIRHVGGAPNGRWPRGHMGARVGATWALVWAPRVRSREEIRRELTGEATPLFKRNFPLLLIRVGLCSHTVFLFCRRRGQATSVRFWLNGGDRVDPSPRDHDQSTCVKSFFKWLRSERLPDATWRREERRIVIKGRSRDRDLTAAVEAAWNAPVRRIFIK